MKNIDKHNIHNYNLITSTMTFNNNTIITRNCVNKLAWYLIDNFNQIFY